MPYGLTLTQVTYDQQRKNVGHHSQATSNTSNSMDGCKACGSTKSDGRGTMRVQVENERLLRVYHLLPYEQVMGQQADLDSLS